MRRGKITYRNVARVTRIYLFSIYCRMLFWLVTIIPKHLYLSHFRRII